MTTTEIKLTHIGPARNLRVIGVQLASPFWPVAPHTQPELIFSDEAKFPVWADPARTEERIGKVRGILATLSGLASETLPLDIVVFPEYAVPQAAHLDSTFQDFADSQNCILAPGTYVDSDPGSPHFRTNVCRIYLPKAEPIIIGKRNPAPFEQKYVLPSTGPNIARLIWSPPDRDPVSISFFICRDYLTPFARAATLSQGADDTDERRELELDWMHEGLHVALMHSPETRLFAGIAGLDLRDLRGKPKLTLLVNGANCAKDHGSALLAPSDASGNDDVIHSLPVGEEGVLTAELRLWDISRPDGVATQAAVGQVYRDAIAQLADGSYRVAPMRDDLGPTYRGVWRPAFLAAMKMALTLEFYAAPNLTEVSAFFTGRRVDNVYAGIVRGEHDLLVRRYVQQSEIFDSEPDFTKTLGARTQADIRGALLDGGKEHFTAKIHPHNIWKYRGQCTVDSAYDERVGFAADRLDIGGPDAQVRRRALVSEILSYADRCERDERPPHRLRPFFYDEPEEVVPVLPVTELRETYLFLDIVAQRAKARSRERFELEVLKGDLMADPRVREIFKLSEASPDHFGYLIKLKCKAHEADQIGRDIRRWADRNSMYAPTRTIDVMEYLMKESVMGIEAANRAEAVQNFIMTFRKDSVQEDEERIASLMTSADMGLVEACARAWASNHALASPRATRPLRDEIFKFWANLVLYCAAPELKFFNAARYAWRAIFDALEERTAAGLRMLYTVKVGGNLTDPAQINDALRDRFMPLWEADQYAMARQDAPKVFFRVFQAAVPRDLAKALKETSPGLESRVRQARNILFHGARTTQAQARLDLRQGDPLAKIAEFQEELSILVSALNLVSEAIAAVEGRGSPE